MYMTERNKLKAIAELYGCKLYYDSKLPHRGQCNYKTGEIVLNYERDAPDVNYSVLFHEIGHRWCYEHGVYSTYHHSKPIKKLTEDEIRIVRLTAFKAECFVESWAQEEMYLMFPEYNYYRFYGTEYSRKWLMDNYLNKHYC